MCGAGPCSHLPRDDGKKPKGEYSQYSAVPRERARGPVRGLRLDMLSPKDQEQLQLQALQELSRLSQRVEMQLTHMQMLADSSRVSGAAEPAGAQEPSSSEPAHENVSNLNELMRTLELAVAETRQAGLKLGRAKWVMPLLASLIVLVLIVSAVALPKAPSEGRVQKHSNLTQAEEMYSWQLAINIGTSQQLYLRSTIMTLLCFFIIMAGCATASAITAIDQKLVPRDFLQKVALPSGRCRRTAAAHALPPPAAGHHLQRSPGRRHAARPPVDRRPRHRRHPELSSSYTFLLYRPFDYPGATVHDSNPFVACAFMPVSEKIYRAVWLVVPSVGFMTTGVIPAVTEGRGYERVLSVVHNVAAPTSMLFCMLMETIQLSCENAFAHLFDTEPANDLYGPLTTVQRMRVVALCMAWCFGITFVGVQGYLLVRTNRSHTVALVSYSAEVFGLCLAFLMPSLGGIDWLIWTTPSDDSWLDETDDAVEIARNIVKCFVSCGTFSSCRWKAELEGEATGALVCDVGARTSIG